MGTPINSLKSYVKAFLPSVTGIPSKPASGDTDYGTQLDPVFEYLSDTAALTDGQLLIGASGTAALTDPITGPTLTGGTGGSLALGAYDVAYTLTNTYGESLPTSPTTITLTGSQTKIAVTAITPLPTGATGANWYVSDAVGSSTLRLHTTNSGAAFNITTLPSTSNALPPSINTTASTAHGVKAVPTGSNGIAITAASGTLDIAYNPAAATDQNGYYLKRLRIENFPTGSLPTLTTADKGRLAYDTTVASLKVWDGTAWQLMGGGGADASTTVKGISKLSVAPVSPTDPIAVGDNDSRMTNSRAPSGAAGGSLGGTYPNPTIADASTTTKGLSKLSTAPASSTNPIAVGDNDSRMTNARTPIGTALNSGNIVVGDGSNLAAAVAVSGDATLANTGALTVTKVQGKAFASTAPSAGNVPTWNATSSQYEPAAPAGGSGAANATSIQGVNVSATAPTNGQALVYNSGTSQYVPDTVSGGGAAFVGCHVYHNADQTITNATLTAINFNSERFDTDAFHDNSTNNTRLTIPSGKGGKYVAGASIRIDTGGATTGQIQLFVKRNGSTYVSINVTDVSSSAAHYNTFGTPVIDLAVGDYLELYVNTTTGSSTTVAGVGTSEYSPEFSLYKVG